MPRPDGDIPATVKAEYVELDGQFSLLRRTVIAEVAGMGEVHAVVSMDYKKVGKYHVWDTLTSRTSLGDQPVITCTLKLSDYRFDDDVKTEKSKRASVPDSD